MNIIGNMLYISQTEMIMFKNYKGGGGCNVLRVTNASRSIC